MSIVTRSASASLEMVDPDVWGLIDRDRQRHSRTLNFIAQREQSYPREVLDLLARLGIDYRREAEVYHLARLPSGMHQYGGWFHSAGSFEGPDPWEADASGRRRLRMTPVDGRFSLTFRRDAQLAPDPLKDQPLVQLEFLVHVPWILDRPEPS